MRIAILGLGFSGLAVAWHLLQRPKVQVVLFDPAGVGGGASGLAAGLLHSYTGAHAKLNKHGIQGMESTSRLLKVAEAALDRPVADYSGMLRVALTEQQHHDFLTCAQRYSDVQWLTAHECQGLVPDLIAKDGLFVGSAISVNCKLYLQGLWEACASLGASLEKQAIQNLQELANFDRVVVTMGASSKLFPELSHLPLSPVKGQILELQWPEGMPHLPFPINSQAYLVRNGEGSTYFAGATFEKEFSTTEAVPEVAIAEIMPKICAFLPALKDAKVIGCYAGIRASTPNHQPIVAQVNDRCWVLAGMGSKGLLYHSLFASQLVQKIMD